MKKITPYFDPTIVSILEWHNERMGRSGGPFIGGGLGTFDYGNLYGDDTRHTLLGRPREREEEEQEVDTRLKEKKPISKPRDDDSAQSSSSEEQESKPRLFKGIPILGLPVYRFIEIDFPLYVLYNGDTEEWYYSLETDNTKYDVSKLILENINTIPKVDQSDIGTSPEFIRMSNVYRMVRLRDVHVDFIHSSESIYTKSLSPISISITPSPPLGYSNGNREWAIDNFSYDYKKVIQMVNTRQYTSNDHYYIPELEIETNGGSITAYNECRLYHMNSLSLNIGYKIPPSIYTGVVDGIQVGTIKILLGMSFSVPQTSLSTDS